jgi:hypothetical protein
MNSSVRSVIERTKVIIDKSRVSRYRVEELKEEITMSQEQTPFLFLAAKRPTRDCRSYAEIADRICGIL